MSGPTDSRQWTLLSGDALDLLPTLPARSFDAVVTDPPYGIGFRDESWDRPARSGADTSAEAFERWVHLWARECGRLLKPGGHVLAFGAPRTCHRLARGIEDAGLELRDQLLWLYGSGVPKGPLVAGRSSTLKPAYEPIVLARAPLIGTHAANERAFRTGRLGVDEARTSASDHARRWPCNVALGHAGACRPKRCASGCAASQLDRSRPSITPSRFFYCPKPSARERDAGCERLPASSSPIYGRGGKAPRHNIHPTVKPLELMRWLTRLGCPTGGRVLDPFAGSGSSGVAALREGRQFVGIEREPRYAEIARARLAHAAKRDKPSRGVLDGRPVGGTNEGVPLTAKPSTLRRRKT
jgi:site-specific DNA-methyltransferase (adenine-specific)